MNKRIIVSVINDLSTDQRVHKMCLFMHEQGYRVLLVGRKQKTSVDLPKRLYQTKRMKLIFEKGPFFYAFFNLRLFLFLFFHKKDILVANDLDTLLPNVLHQRIFKKKLVYDSHELFTEVPELIHRPKVQQVWQKIETYSWKSLDQIITVNKSIATFYEKKYGKPLYVVRNISPIWNAANCKSKLDLGIPEGKFTFIMQGAGLNVDRGLEEAIEAISAIENAQLIVVGDGDVIPKMKDYVRKNNWRNIYFYQKRPYEELMQFTHHADIGLSFDKPSNANYLNSLPNKIFDYIHTNTPILCTDLPEVKHIVEANCVGKVVLDLEKEKLVKQLKEIILDVEQTLSWKTNCEAAKNRLNWEAETVVLRSIYPKQ